MTGLSFIPSESRGIEYLGQLNCELVFRGSLIRRQGLVIFAAHLLGTARQTQTEDSISVRLTLVPHRLAGHTNPLETGRTLRPGIVVIFIDLHQHRTLRVRTILSRKGVEQLSVML